MSTTIISDKEQTFLLNIVILEGRHYMWSHANTAVLVKVDNKTKSTAVKDSTDNPYYNEYFVFEFNTTLENLLDKPVLITVIQPKTCCKKRKTLGYVGFDVNYVWVQPDHQFYHRWATLRSPKQESSSRIFRGYVKLDICITFKGQIPKIPLHVQNDEIDGNLLVQEEGILERQPAFFIFDVYKCINLSYKPSNLAYNINKGCKTEECGPNSYIEIRFAGRSVRTNTFYNAQNPVINQRLIIKDMFPTVCQRIKIEVHYADYSVKVLHSSYNIDLKLISNSHDDGFLPTYGPAFIHLYTKYNLQGYAGSVLLGMTTEIKDITMKENTLLNKEIPKYLLESISLPMDKSHLFVIITEITSIPKKYTNKPISFMVSHGNNTAFLDDIDFVRNNSHNIKRINSIYFYFKIEEKKPCFHVICEWADFRRRMFNSNILDKIVKKLRSYIIMIENLLDERQFEEVDKIVDEALDYLTTSSVKYVDIVKRYTLEKDGTNLEKERMKMLIQEMAAVAKNAVLIHTKETRKKSFKMLLKKLKTLERLKEEAQQCWPDVFIWMIYGNKKIAGVQIHARDILFSVIEEECGRFNSIEQTLFLTKSRKNYPMDFTSKIRAKVWLGLERQKKHALDIIPAGFSFNPDIEEPNSILADEKHYFQCRVHIFQGKVSPGFDKTGLVDAFVMVYIKDKWNKTHIQKATLNPIWDQTLMFRNILLYGSKSYIKENPPDILIELYDKDRCGSEFVGRGCVKPIVKMKEDPYAPPLFPPKLTWNEIYNEYEMIAEILSAFELLETGTDEIEDVRSEESLHSQFIVDIPSDIKPSFQTYRLEVFFWGVRNLKDINNIQICKPRITVIIQNVMLNSETLTNAEKNLNFTDSIRSCDLTLPDQEEYCPPLRIKMFDSRHFGIYIFAGVYIGRVQPYIEHLMKFEERQFLLSNVENVPINYLKDDSSIIEIFSKHSIELSKNTSTKSIKSVKSKPDIDYRTILRYRVVSLINAIKDIRNQSMSLKKSGPQVSAVIVYEDETFIDLEDYDWWTKFYASEKEYPKDLKRYKIAISDKYKLKIYQSELELQPEFKGFSDMLCTFDIFKGKRTGDEALDEVNIRGLFKGQIKLYQWPPEDENTDYVTKSGILVRDGIFQGFPASDPVKFVARVYCVQALNLRPQDVMGKSDPYLKLFLSKHQINDKENYVANQVNPVFGRCFELQGTFPYDHTLKIECWDWDRLSVDDLIGLTTIDIENRYYTKHRANCGIPDTYQLSGYCEWRDYQKPSSILQSVCNANNLGSPVYEETSVRIGSKLYEMDPSNTRSDPLETKQVLALTALRRWNEMPVVGHTFVPEHVETRSLFHPAKPGIEQGKLQLWIDILPYKEDRPLPKPIDISPRKPKSYELRVIIWNTVDVLLTEDDFFLGERKSDIYVKGWLTSIHDAQSTDVHYRSLSGEGNFNWRFVFPFEYLATENQMVFRRKDNKFSMRETEFKTPCKLTLQVWDNDTISPDDFIGQMSLELARLPKGAPSAEKCDLSVFDPMAKTLNLFKIKRTKGWWPFSDIDKETQLSMVTGKLEVEIEILLVDDADIAPAGLGRDEPQALPPPKRPDVSFSWFRNPLKALKYVVCKLHRWKIIRAFLFLLLFVFIALVIYAFPGYTVKRFMGA